LIETTAEPTSPDDGDGRGRGGAGITASDQALRGARKAWYRYAWGSHAFTTTVLTVFLGPFLTDTARNAAGSDSGFVQVLGVGIRADSYYPFTVALAVIIEFCLLPVLGAVADTSGRRRTMQTGMMILGAIATLGFVTVTGSAYLWGGALFLVANTGYGGANALNNGYLPELAGADERDRISSTGWAIGYLGGFVLLAVDLGLYLGHASFGLSQTQAARIALASAGVWWLAFGLGAVRGLPAGTMRPTTGAGSLRQLGHTLRELAANRQALLFVIAFILYNEGIQTVISFASTYATKELGLTLTVTIEAILIIQPVAFVGALWLGRLSGRYGPRRTVTGSLVAWMGALVLASGLSYGSAVQFLALGVLIGLVLGGSQALSRSLFAQIVPAGREAEYFGLYEISQNGTAWIGSLTIALALQWTNSYRFAIVSLLVFFGAGLVLLLRTDLRAAIAGAGNAVPDGV
jgi:MFS transporter, UMF1 family